VAKKPALGKGMSALIGTGYEEPADKEKNSIIEVSVESIKGNPDQPRKTFDEESLNELASSIREKGIIQPIIVEKSTEGYLIIAGERRFRASKIAGLKTIPVIIKDFSDNEKLEIALIENIQREDLNPIEEASAYRELMEKGNFNQESVALKVGKNRSTVANSLRLLKLPAEIRKSLAEGAISAGHARAILALNTEAQMKDLHRRIIDEGLSVREAEAYAPGRKDTKSGKSGTVQAAPSSGEMNPELKIIQEKFIDILGTKVNILGNLKKGKIEISYFSMEDLERLYDIINT
jgi:ParB family chromosome partitioning protein